MKKLSSVPTKWGNPRRRESSLSRHLFLTSTAATREKETIATPLFCGSAWQRVMKRSTTVCVLPAPGQADTNKSPPGRSTTSCCSSDNGVVLIALRYPLDGVLQVLGDTEGRTCIDERCHRLGELALSGLCRFEQIHESLRLVTFTLRHDFDPAISLRVQFSKRFFQNSGVTREDGCLKC